jgi:hypothetical protein
VLIFQVMRAPHVNTPASTPHTLQAALLAMPQQLAAAARTALMELSVELRR